MKKRPWMVDFLTDIVKPFKLLKLLFAPFKNGEILDIICKTAKHRFSMHFAKKSIIKNETIEREIFDDIWMTHQPKLVDRIYFCRISQWPNSSLFRFDKSINFHFSCFQCFWVEAKSVLGIVTKYFNGLLFKRLGFTQFYAICCTGWSR